MHARDGGSYDRQHDLVTEIIGEAGRAGASHAHVGA